MWSQATGMVDLKAGGYPNERPAAMSRGGKVVTWGSWYELGNPASAVPLPPLPQGFVGAGKTFSKAGKESVVLQVTDNAGLTASKKVMFTILR